MTTTLTTRPAAPTEAPGTRRLLLAGAASAPLWGAVALAQAGLRPDFDFAVEPLSALSTGSLGWLQITNFVVGGLLTVAGAVGLGRTTSRGIGRAWAVSGLGLVAAGVFVLDAPGSGTLTWHGIGHLLAGTVSFAALVVTCVLLAVRLGRAGRRGAAAVSVLAALAVVVGNAWAMTGGAYGSMTLGFGVLAAMLWVSGVCAARR